MPGSWSRLRLIAQLLIKVVLLLSQSWLRHTHLFEQVRMQTYDNTILASLISTSNYTLSELCSRAARYGDMGNKALTAERSVSCNNTHVQQGPTMFSGLVRTSGRFILVLFHRHNLGSSPREVEPLEPEINSFRVRPNSNHPQGTPYSAGGWCNCH